MQGSKPALFSKLEKKPNTESLVPAKDNGVVFNIKRALPASAMKRPTSDKMKDFKKNPGAAAASSPPGESADAPMMQQKQDTGGEEDIRARALNAQKKVRASAGFTDSRHKYDVNRDDVLAKASSLRVAPVISEPATSLKRLDQSELVRDEDLEDKSRSAQNLAEEQDESAQAVKLSKRGILEKTSVIAKNKGVAASLIEQAERDQEEADAEVLEDTGAGAGVAVSAAAAASSSSSGQVEKILKVRQRKPKSSLQKEPVIPVSAASASAKEQVAKIAKKSKEDAKQDDKYALSLAIRIGDEIVAERLPAKVELPQLQASNFYMNNRAKFIQYVNALFHNYREEITSGDSDISCEALYGGDDSASVSLLVHQKIVREYLNIYSPYRGLLLFHGLGSGKTCSSIAIAEGLKTFKKIIVMTPASLRMNYMEEIRPITR
jgi:hypothetical protein